MSPERSEGITSGSSVGSQTGSGQPIVAFSSRREFVPSRVLLGAPVRPLGVHEVEE